MPMFTRRSLRRLRPGAMLLLAVYAGGACAPAVRGAPAHRHSDAAPLRAEAHPAPAAHAGAHSHVHSHAPATHAVPHPEPRSTATRDKVLSPDTVAARGFADAARVYRLAQEVPHVLDGLYCHCNCSKHSGHYSLLSCFETLHGARCSVCLREAEVAHRLHGEGKTLDQIRVQVDSLFTR